ncbi:MAG: ECF transporter S component [Christensenellaceae bacterium]|jgi:riboflavin transporter FmnP|nr:ECF transporter S component [Christensenellaceae bacterium]
MQSEKTKWLARMAALCAISLVLMYLVRFPLFPAAPYLEYDMADVPILIGAFIYGPGAGLLLTAIVSLLQWLLVSPQSGWVGALMHLCATGGFVLVAGFLYKARHTRPGAIVSLLLGTLTMAALMVPLNLWLTVRYNGAPAQVVQAMIGPVILPFNLIKGCINSLVTFIVYKRAGKALRLYQDGEA